MKPEEIQLGDWLRYEYTEGGEEEGEIEYYDYDFRVNQIYFGMGTQEVSGEDGDIYDIADVQPIPLTPEILEKNGFTKSERYEVWKTISDAYELRITPWRIAVIFLGEDGSDKEEFSAPRPKYVHDLQHSLRLCGIEKEIIL